MRDFRLLGLLPIVLLLGASPAGAVSRSSLRVSGTVSAVSAGTLTISAVDGQAMSFRLVATTTYAKDGRTADFSALQVSASVRVKYHLEANGSLKAKEVDVETGTGVASAALWVRGSVVSVTPGLLVMKNDAGGQELTMRLSPTTGYVENDRPALISDLQPGAWVKVKYRMEPDRSLKAKKVKIELRQSVSFQLDGTIVQAGATSMRVRVAGLRENGALVRAAAGRIVTVASSPSTAVVRNGGKTRPAAPLVVGDHVHASGTVTANVFSAARIVTKHAVRKR